MDSEKPCDSTDATFVYMNVKDGSNFLPMRISYFPL